MTEIWNRQHKKPMSEFDLSDTAQQWVNLILLWIGFAAVVGLVVRSFLPGKEPSGLLGTLMVGIFGSCVGPFLVSVIWKPENFNPIGAVGFTASVICAFVSLAVYRIFTLIYAKAKPKT